VIRRNALIFHSGGLGDFLLSWPLGLALGRLHPQSRIIYVTQASKGALAAKALGLEWCDLEQSWSAMFSDPAGLNEQARKTISAAHGVYTFIASADDAFCRNAAQLAPSAAIVPLRIAPPPDFSGHALDYLISQLSAYPAVSSAVTQIVASISRNGLYARPPHNAGPVLIHPGSGSREKCWPVSSFIDLIQKLHDAGSEVRVLLGEVELERLSADEKGRLEAVAPVIKPATYVDLYAALSAGAGFIGHDSGPTHLAAMMGLPTLALFGPSDPAVWRPIGPRAVILQLSPLSGLNADDVFRGWQRLPRTASSGKGL